ncbi:phage tail assembly protein [Escherichia coli]|jgi:phage FluMu protein gp41|uniref:Mu-like prophage FluMu protein gp41 n=4 Tax=Enterobacteriaceae TaxID=543 RepID=A0A822TD76_SHISO|nr:MULTISPECIES: phage tail assembly protein [Enterobacteriaceae]EIG6216869.1 phage tail assembly protein [Shigella dysenteriae]EIH4989833.1 phage tail assembly protein [Shigella boydii]HDL6812002.1 phage tail assembly protein [Escherichia coli 371_08]HDL6817040.1 phage tail assembly protein [Escherichia coli 290_10]HDL6830756.1 phage tail assembly protein [Escherichia coli 229_11]HDL7558863.1 phage tail assembly protein [Escherichia coli 151_06]
MSTRKKKTAVSDEAVMEAIRDALEDGDPRTAGLAEQLANGYVDLLDGLPFGESREYRVTFRELTAKDSIDAESEAERLMETRNGPVLVASPALRGIALLRRQIAAVGQIEGPLSPRQIGQLSERDLSRLMAAVSLLDSAMAGKLVAERGRPDAVPGSD